MLRWGTGMALALAAACGRFGYDPLADDDDSSGGDAAAADAPGSAADAATNPADASLPPDASSLCTMAGCMEQTLGVGADENDGTMLEGMWFRGGVGGRVQMGRRGGTTAWGYFRFELATAIAAGATIEDARLRVFAIDQANWNPVNDQLAVMAEDTDDAQVITSFEERPDGTIPGFVRFPTAALVVWDPGGLTWPTSAIRETPNLAAPLQELVDRYGGLAAGAHVQFWARGHDFVSDSTVAAADVTFVGGVPASLAIAWTP